MSNQLIGTRVIIKDDIELADDLDKRGFGERKTDELLLAPEEALYLKDAIIHTHPKSRASRAYKEIAARLLGEEYFKNYQEKQKSFWKKIFG